MGELRLGLLLSLLNPHRAQFALDPAGVLDERMDIYFTETLAEHQKLLINFLIIVKGAGKNVVDAGDLLEVDAFLLF